MPMITVRYVTPSPQPELRSRIAGAAAQLSAEKLGQDPNVTAVLVEAADPEGWFIAGHNPAAAGLSAFWLDIKITSGTNTKNKTTNFVASAFQTMSEILGPLHVTS